MSGFRIEKAKQERMREVAAVFKASKTYSLPFLPELHTAEEDMAFFTNVVFPENEVHVAIGTDNRIIGFIAFNQDWVNHLYLLPEAQGKGIGSSLLALAKQHSRRLLLWTFEKNLKAQRFYEKQGFNIIKRTDGSGNEEREPDVMMEWQDIGT